MQKSRPVCGQSYFFQDYQYTRQDQRDVSRTFLQAYQYSSPMSYPRQDSRYSDQEQCLNVSSTFLGLLIRWLRDYRNDRITGMNILIDYSKDFSLITSCLALLALSLLDETCLKDFMGQKSWTEVTKFFLVEENFFQGKEILTPMKNYVQIKNFNKKQILFSG